MARLGEFGTQHERPVDQPDEMVTFGWFGSEIRLTQHYSQIKLMNLMEAARSVDREDPMAMVVVKDTLRVMIHPGDFGLFWSLAEQEDQTLEDLATVVQAVFEGMTKRPTPQQPDSSPGLLSTPESSPADSPTPASAGRPDLQMLQDGAEETRARLAAAAGATGA